MSRFYFIAGNGPPSAKQLREAIDSFADLLSLDSLTLSQIAERMGISTGSACVLLHQLCSLYGERAQA